MKRIKAIHWAILAYVFVVSAVLSLISCDAHHTTATSATPGTWGTTQVITQQPSEGKCMNPDATGLPQQLATTAPELEVNRQGNSTKLFVNAGTRPGAVVKMHGNGSGVFVVGDVAARTVIFADGNDGCIQIFGAVGKDAVVAVSGNSGQIFINGPVAPTARLCVETGQSYIRVIGNVGYGNFRSTNSAFRVQTLDTDMLGKPVITVPSCRILSSKLTITTH